MTMVMMLEQYGINYQLHNVDECQQVNK